MTLFYTLFISGLQILLFWSYKHNKNQDLSNKSLLHSSNKINTSCGTDHNIHDKVIFWLTELRGRVRVPPPIDCPSPLLREACIGQCPQITFPYLSYFLKRPIRQRECEIIKFSCSRWNGDLFCTIVGIFFFRLCLSFRDVGSIRNRQWSCCRDQLLPYGLYWTGGNLIKN